MRWLFAAVVVFALAWALKAGLVVYAAVTLGLVAVAGRFLSGADLKHVAAQRQVSETEIDVGDTVKVKLEIENRASRSIIWLLLEDLLPESALKQRPPKVQVKGRRLRVRSLGARHIEHVAYTLTFAQRGVYPVGPLIVESGDLFGFVRRYRVLLPPNLVTVLPRVVPLLGYEIASRRPIGDVRLTHRLYEDPTRIAGVRPYEPGDPLNRVHWRATARTGRLHSKIYDPSTLAGATLLWDLHADGYPQRGEPYRSELAAMAAASLAHAILQLQQQVGLWSNGADGVTRWAETTLSRLRRSGLAVTEDDLELTEQMRDEAANEGPASASEILGVPTRRGWDQLMQIRRLLARLEPSDRRSFAEFVTEIAPRLPRDATAMAILPAVPEASALALGNLRRQGFAVAAVLVIPGEAATETALGRLAAQGIRDVRVLEREEQLPELCQAQFVPTPMALST